MHQMIISAQRKLHSRHAKWVEFLQSFSFVSKYKLGHTNVVANALSRKLCLRFWTLGFSDFNQWNKFTLKMRSSHPSSTIASGEFKVHILLKYGFLFKGNRLCVLKSFFSWIAYSRGAWWRINWSFFGINKTLEVLQEHFKVCMLSSQGVQLRLKTHFHQGLYTPLPVPLLP